MGKRRKLVITIRLLNYEYNFYDNVLRKNYGNWKQSANYKRFKTKRKAVNFLMAMPLDAQGYLTYYDRTTGREKIYVHPENHYLLDKLCTT